MIEDEMVGWHHRLDGHEFGQAPGMAMDMGAWRAAVHGVTKIRTRPSDRPARVATSELLPQGPVGNHLIGSGQ